MTHALEFPHLRLLALGLGLAILCAWLLLRRRQRVGWSPAIMLTTGVICAALAAGSVRIVAPADDAVRVYVDLTPSTRTADFRDDLKLKHRIRELLGGGSYEIVAWDGLTRLVGPALLFSDGQEPAKDAAGPIYPVIDPALSRAQDARVVEIVHEGGAAWATLENSGGPRQLSFGPQQITVPSGRYRVRVGSESEAVAAALNAGDAWPENDQLKSLPQAGGGYEAWACGVADVGERFRTIAASELPQHASAYASTSILLLDAGAGAQLSPTQQQAVASWVRNLGGALVIVGQDRAWASLRQSAIDEISPLSPDPPSPARQWVLAIDGSGSMSQVQDGQEKWRAAFAAGAQVSRGLPSHDLLSVGLFSSELAWLGSGAAAEMIVEPAPGFIPRGPTNLEAALQSVLALPPSSARELILLTDAEVELGNLDGMAEQFRAAGVRISCLILSEGRGVKLLQELCRRTGGAATTELDSRLWATRAGELASRLAPGRWQDSAIEISTADPLSVSLRTVAGWNEAFLRDGATAFAESAERPLAGAWRVGLGSVVTLAFPLRAGDAEQMADKLEVRPADPRFEVQWLDGVVQVEAAGEVNLQMELAGPGGHWQRVLTAVAPGRYQAPLPDISGGAHVVISEVQRIVGRRSFAPRYAREFDHIGTNVPALQQLALTTGGRVIFSEEAGPLKELFSLRYISLVGLFGCVAVILIAGAVLVLRRRLTS